MPEHPVRATLADAPWRWLLLAAVLVALDQLSKQVAEAMLTAYQPVPVLPFFNLTLMYNPGAAFSFLSEAGGWQRWFFSVLAIAVSGFILGWLWRAQHQGRALPAALALILSGAIGNLIDRLLHGEVIDFIQLYAGRFYWPAFNVADSAIFCGAVLLVVHSLFIEPRNRTNSDANDG